MPARLALLGSLLLAWNALAGVPRSGTGADPATGDTGREPVAAGDLDWDDDGDCYCEVGPCEGGVRPECGEILEGDCLDSPSDPRAKEANPGREEDCGDAIDNDCDGFVNEECSAPARYASVRGGGCSTAPGARPASLAFALALVLALPALRRRRS